MVSTAFPDPPFVPFVCSQLSCYQTWLDERLFGWSRSAKRGTSAWAGTRSHDISRVATPDASDDEDHPDYDDLNIPSGDGHSLATRPRSQRSSYADIQRLRMTGFSSAGGSNGSSLSPLSPAAATATSTGEKHIDNEGLHFRGQTRTRKASLSDDVPVEVIGSVDREEPFKDATQDLNKEMDKRRESRSNTLS